ncbi:hypothetical protein TPL01_25780 [Sulfuriferula plumbiphila]|uniref:Transposase InsH N-terminal domain-containing protein n=1 Tax=Sulfuriferula plumbiphila TaxID=171865 RepID=A0A512LAD6_9PROT|nr:transposase [Sulfuriferula plumbiphila]BBP04993.1 hypothetical protein SFPGR_24150 [Sulfuriferula plumbiphila]GEP31440.1 hypothetical protein TPL01_25780 [Sulfuriferula plumbiphila]
MQQWFNFPDRQMEDALYEIESIRRFAGFTTVTAALPDETTILKFRHRLEGKALTEPLLAAINGHLKAQEMLISKGTMVDARIIHAPSSTRNAAGERDPEQRLAERLCTSSITIRLALLSHLI